MKFKIKKDKLEHMLEMLMLKDVLPTAVLTMQNGKLFSIQQEEHARALRLLKLNENFFEDKIEGEDESVEIDVATILSILKRNHHDNIVKVSITGNKISIVGDRVDVVLPVREPDDVKTKLPFIVDENGVPLFGEDKKPLDVHILMTIDDYKDFCAYANPIKTDFFKFLIEEGLVKARIGDVHDFDKRIKFTPRAEIKSGTELDVTFPYAIPQIGDTYVGFESDIKFMDKGEEKQEKHKVIGIRGRSGFPMWFYEKTDEYFLGVIVPPYVEE